MAELEIAPPFVTGKLEMAARELLQGGRSADALPALRRIVELHPDTGV